eukprot:340260_1
MPINMIAKSGEFKRKTMNYIYKLYESHASLIDDIFRDHFQINDSDFVAKCITEEKRMYLSVSRRFTLSKTYTQIVINEPIEETEMAGTISKTNEKFILINV